MISIQRKMACSRFILSILLSASIFSIIQLIVVSASSTKHLRSNSNQHYYNLKEIPRNDRSVGFYSDFDDDFGFNLDERSGSDFDAEIGTSYYSPEFTDSRPDSKNDWSRRSRRQLDRSETSRIRSLLADSPSEYDSEDLEYDGIYLDEYYSGGIDGLEEASLPVDDDYGDDSSFDDESSPFSYPCQLFTSLLDQIKTITSSSASASPSIAITSSENCNQCILPADKCNADHVVCPLDRNYQPVCGCDGNTYENACSARYFHCNSHWTDGPCSQLHSLFQ